MFTDAKTLTAVETLDTDLCIVGAGAAGIALALQFLKCDIRVLLLEAGDFGADPETQTLYDGEVSDPALHCPPRRYRLRQFGGSTNAWGGRCVPLDPIDFEYRPWIPRSGWPVAYDDVASYYAEATALCEAGDGIYHAATAVDGGMKPLIRGFEPAEFSTEGIERFSCPTNFGTRYAERLRGSANVRVLLNANCTEIITTSNGATVDCVEVRTLSGIRFRVRASNFVLAAGGIEIPRLLLASRRQNAAGVANGSGMVGRCYMCHIAGTIGELAIRGTRDQVHYEYERAWDGVYCRRRISLTEDAQKRMEVANMIVRLHHPRVPDPKHGSGILSSVYFAKPLIRYEYAKRLHEGAHNSVDQIYHHAINVVTQPVDTIAFLVDWIRTRNLAARKMPSIIVPARRNLYSLDVNAEQHPNRDSRVALAERTDRFGMPLVHIDWRYQAADIESVAKTLSALRTAISRSGVGTLNYSDDEVETCMLRDGAYGGHHIGTTRMSASPSDGVVDRDLRAHDVDNLYIASSSVFPTSGQANPTLTIVALSLRLAEALKCRFDQRAVSSTARREVATCA